jgi:hypothetical protein
MQQVPGSTTNLDPTSALILQKYGLARSNLWPAVEKEFLAKNQKCAVCPSSLQLQVHHMYPFHLCHLVYRGDLELDERNFMVLCEENVNDHHLLLGHLGSFESYNTSIRNGIIALAGSLPSLAAVDIKSNQSWQNLMRARPLPWEQWSHQLKLDFRQLLDNTFPFVPTQTFAAPYPFLDDGTANEQAIQTTYRP